MAANMVVRTNIFSLNAHRNMKNTGLEQQRASNRLASGFRINTAADDAAGLAISETMRAQIRGLDQASRNAQDGQALILTTEGGMQEITNMLQRVRELLVQAANDTNVDVNREQIALEINQLAEEIGSMQERVQFNTRQTLLMGNANIDALRAPTTALLAAQEAVVDRQADVVAAQGTLDAAIAVVDGHFSSIRATVYESGGTATEPAWAAAIPDWMEVNIETIAGAIPAASGWGDYGDYDANLAQIVGRDALVAAINAIGAARLALNGQAASATTAPSPVTAGAIGNLNTATALVVTRQGEVAAARSLVIAGAGVAELHFQIGANTGESLMHDFASINLTIALSQFAVETAGAEIVGADGAMITNFIDSIQTELDAINMERAALGALQNRLDYTMRSLDISSENLQDSESRVRNADMAREMMRFTMQNVLSQAATAMLAQANQIPNNLLQLLR